MSDEIKMDTTTPDQSDMRNSKDCDASEGEGTGDDYLQKGEQKIESEETSESVVSEKRQTFLELEEENAELRDRAMRFAAEMENLRRRTERDIADSKSYSITGFARDMLSVSDNLARALASISPEECEKDSGFKSLVEGVKMTERAMMSILQRYGVQKIEPLGKRFDPNFHQAMFELSDPSIPANTVTQIIQDGYVIGERVLRPAMVGVTKGGAKQEVFLESEEEKEGCMKLKQE